LHVWLPAEDCPTKGFAHRPGWHCMLEPHAPHMKIKDRVWIEVEVADYEIFERPPSQGGRWVLAKWIKAERILDSICSKKEVYHGVS